MSALLGPRLRLLAAGVALVAGAAACSGDGFQPGATVFTGIIVVPPPQQCVGCNGAGAQVRLLELVQNEAPRVVKCVDTNDRAIYDTSDENTCPDISDGTLPPGDSEHTVIVVAIVNDRGAQIGGLVSTRLGSVTDRDFNGTTNIACEAGLFLTSGTASFGNPGCTVQASCPAGLANCFTTVPANTLSQQRIDNLEAASLVLEGQVDFTLPNGVDPAACAVIVCTQAGAVAGSPECLEAQLNGG